MWQQIVKTIIVMMIICYLVQYLRFKQVYFHLVWWFFFFTLPIAWSNILASWRNNSSQLLNANGLNDVRQTEIHTAEPLVPELNGFEVQMAIESYKYVDHQILIKFQQNWLKQGVEQIALRSINLLIVFGIRSNFLPDEWKELIIVPIY